MRSSCVRLHWAVKKNAKSVHGVFVITVDKREWLAVCRKRNEFNVVKYLEIRIFSLSHNRCLPLTMVVLGKGQILKQRICKILLFVIAVLILQWIKIFTRFLIASVLWF